MTGRFRFTPVCCCGGEEPAPVCVPGCIPECAEIFNGMANHPRHLRDSDSSTEVTDSSFILINSLNGYYDGGAGCSYFTVTGSAGAFYANPTAGQSAGNHMVGQVAYELTMPTSILDGFATQSSSGAITSKPVSSQYEAVVTTGRNPGPASSTLNADNFVTQFSYDGELHSVSPLFLYRRFCLPFTEDLCFTDGQSVQLTPAEEIGDYYLPLEGDPEWNCTFSWPDSCSFVDTIGANHFSADELQDKIGQSAFQKDPALDFYVVRLFGFTPPAMAPNGFWSDTAVSKEFSVAYGLQDDGNDGTVTVPIIMADISVGGFSLVSANFDADYNKTGHDDYPAEILGFTGTTQPVTASQIIFGSNDTSALAGVNSPGSDSTMPNLWKTPRTMSLPYTPHEDNSFRYNGIWWIHAAMSRCGNSFPEDVTRGTVWQVPVGLFTLNRTSFSTNYYGTYGGMMGSWPLTRVKASALMSYAEIHQPLTIRNQYTNKRYMDEFWMTTDPTGTNPHLVRPYIPKPSGKRLERLVWRCFRDPVALIGRNRIPPQSNADIETAHQVSLEIYGDLTSGGSNVPLPDDMKDEGYKVTVVLDHVIHPYPMVNGFYKPDLYDYTPGDEHVDTGNLVTNYAQSSGMNICETSVNGDSFLTLTDKNGDTVYMPSMTNEKLESLFGTGSIRLMHQAAAGNMTLMNYEIPVTVCPRYNFDYIAVWRSE